MAYPKKRGLRQITVDDVIYRWRFAGSEMKGTLTIYGPNSSDRVLVVNSYEWFDLWMSYPFALRQAPEDVTPAIVRRAIEFGLNNGWVPSARGETLTFWYFNSEFQSIEPNAEAVRELRKLQFKGSDS